MRLDEWLFQKQGLLPSKSKAIQFIREIGVEINGKLVQKPGYRVKDTDLLDIESSSLENYKKPFGYRKFKFLTSKTSIPFSIKDKCLDIGASAGGFSLYMLEQGVESVLAIEISSRFQPFLEEIRKQYPDKFSYWIEDFFKLTLNRFPHLFNLVTADLTLDPYFLVRNLDLFVSILEPSTIQARLLLTIKTGNITSTNNIMNQVEELINQISSDLTYQWLESLPDKQELFLLLLKL
ncbi:MAG: S4 domain-containing protein [Promethearchaeota archaeon]